MRRRPGHDGGVLTIGELSRLTHLSVRTLRDYRDDGLLEPDAVDDLTGYRSYGPAQIADAQVVRHLLAVDVPPDHVRRILRVPDQRTRASLAAEHLPSAGAVPTGSPAAVVALRRLLGSAPVDVEVELREVPDVTVAAVAGHVARDDVATWSAEAAAELDATVGAPVGPPGALHDNALFEDDRGRVLVHRPADDTQPRVGRVHAATLPAATLAVTTHTGPPDDLDVTYGALGAWVVAHDLAVAGPARETYLVGPRDTSDASAWRTEIAWPVFRMAE